MTEEVFSICIWRWVASLQNVVLALIDTALKSFCMRSPENPDRWIGVFVGVINSCLSEILSKLKVRANFVLDQGQRCIEQEDAFLGPFNQDTI